MEGDVFDGGIFLWNMNSASLTLLWTVTLLPSTYHSTIVQILLATSKMSQMSNENVYSFHRSHLWQLPST